MPDDASGVANYRHLVQLGTRIAHLAGPHTIDRRGPVAGVPARCAPGVATTPADR
jgi:hypothetical protein